MGTNVCVFLFKSLILSILVENVADDELRSKPPRVVVVLVGVKRSVSTKSRISTGIEIRANVRSYIYD